MKENNIFNLLIEDELALITFNVKEAKMNTWTDSAIESFLDIIDEISDLAKNKAIKGAIFISGKEGSFLTGADLNTLASKNTRLDYMKDIEIFHIGFNRLNNIEIPTLAAISGYCLGGGLEFALACDYRIAKDNENTILGFPEIQVGLFPAGGGTQRLTRLIGYPAIDLIMNATMIPAKKAYELGIIDECVDGDLLEEAKSFLSNIVNGTIEINREQVDLSDIDNKIEEAKDKSLKTNRGSELPYIRYALDTIKEGIKLPLSEGLELEKRNFVEVATSNESKGKINTYFLKNMTDKPKKMMSQGFSPKNLNKAAVVGFGTMGRGIVIEIIRKMKTNVLVKDDKEVTNEGIEFVKSVLTKLYEKKRLNEKPEDLISLITPVDEYTDDFNDVDIVIEAVFEDLDTKKDVFDELSKVVSEYSILVSNTSYLSIDELSKSVVNPERFAGLHFFSPVWLMKLVEIIKSENTSQQTVNNLLNFVGLIRKRPVVCKDSPGFVVNAVLDPFMSNSLRYLEEGNAPEKIDQALLDFGMPVGPIRLNDEVGLDVSYHINHNRGIEQKTLENLFKAGFKGLKKNGKGFFLENGDINPEAMKLVHKRTPVERRKTEMAEEIHLDMVKIGEHLLRNGVVNDVRMIDIGMLWGVGYPSDKGGPMKWADLTGISEKYFNKKFYNKL